MLKKTCWVWFKDGIKDKGHWESGFTFFDDGNEGVLIENHKYVSCRVPKWRIRTTEPNNKNDPPEIPEDPKWKL